MTDNDRGGWRTTQYSGLWAEAGLHALQHRTDAVTVDNRGRRAVRIVARVRIAPPVFGWGIDCVYRYTVQANGEIVIDVTGTPHGDYPATLPRIGLQLTIPRSFRHVAWHGRGPGESYRDTKQAQRFGLWQARVDDLYTPYVFPQENGNRTDVDWVRLTDRQETGICARCGGDDPLNFSAHRYTTEDLDAARHPTDLVRRDFITLNLDHQHQGIGTASCGPGPLDRHLLKTGPFRFSVRLRPVG
jgi:beta-galactosidase/evolved beta-galactosidase subunit alpha